MNINSNSNNQFGIISNNNKDQEQDKGTKIIKAINLIDDFVTKFISKIEYYKMTL